MRLSTCVPGLCQQTTVYVRATRRTLTLTCTYGEKVATLKAERSCFPAFSALLLFSCFLPSFLSSKACRCVAMQKKTGSRPPALVSMERHARKTKTSELYKHHSTKIEARTTHGGVQVSNQDWNQLLGCGCYQIKNTTRMDGWRVRDRCAA